MYEAAEAVYELGSHACLNDLVDCVYVYVYVCMYEAGEALYEHGSHAYLNDLVD
jgi:hypothetical protein